MAAVVQGMDETVVNGAQLFFVEQFGLTNDTLLQGLVNGKCIPATREPAPQPTKKNIQLKTPIRYRCAISCLRRRWRLVKRSVV
jgi:hypothetical protein